MSRDRLTLEQLKAVTATTGSWTRVEGTEIMMTIPNMLTLLRVALIPFLVLALALKTESSHWIGFWIFVAASCTDYLDGKLARSLSQISPFGKFFDPVADKLLVAASILMLAALGRLPDLHIIPGLVILCREIFVSGLREFLAQINVTMPVSPLGKVKTAFQFGALAVLILNPEQTFEKIPYLQGLGFMMLWAAAILTLISGYDYLRTGIVYLMREENK